jgi:RHS repeat-associated protein
MKKTSLFSNKRLLIYLLLIGSISILTLSRLYSSTPPLTIVSVGNEPRGGAFNPSTNKGIVSNHNTNTVSIINATTYAITTVTVGSHPYGVAVNNSTNKAYIANEQSDTVSVLTLSTNTVSATIPVGGNPRGIAVNSTTNVGVIANSKANTVSILNLATNAVASTLAVGTDPEGVVINTTANTAYVTNYGSNTVSVINLANNTVTATINVGLGPMGIDINTTSSMIMVANRFSNTVSVINTSTNTVTATINVGLAPFGVAINSTTGIAYVSNEYSDSVSVINMSTNTITTTYAAGENPEGIAVVPSLSLLFIVNDKANQIYIINLASPPTTAPSISGIDPEGLVVDLSTNTAVTANSKTNTLSVINLANSTLIATIPVGKGPQDVALNPNTKALVTANSRDNTATIIDYPSRTVLAVVNVGNRPKTVAIDPGLNIAVVGNELDGTLSLINLATYSVTATIPSGSHPADIAINPNTHIAVVANKKTDMVTVINLQTQTTVTTIAVGKDPVSVSINPNTNVAVVTNQKSNSVSIINLNTNTVTATISGILTPIGSDINLSTNIAAIISHESATLTLINLATNTVSSTLTGTGPDPEDVAMNMNTNIAVVTNETSLGVSLIQLPNPVPALTSLSPSLATAGGASFTLLLNGSQFVTTSTITFSNLTISPQFISTTQLSATIPASAITTAGSATVNVINLTPGGGKSNSLTFTINPALPAISSITPSSATAGSASFQMIVNGGLFAATSTVNFSGTTLTPIFVSSSQLKVTIPASNVATAGIYPVKVVNTGGLNSNIVNFTVNNTVPTLTSLSPNSVTAGSSSVVVTLTGMNFLTTSTINFSGTALTPQYVTTSQLKVTIPAANLTTGGVFPVTVSNPAPGGGTSGSQSFTVNNPLPTLTTLSPNSATAGSSNLRVTLTGTNFVTTSTVNFSGIVLTPQYVSTTQLNVTVPASSLTTGGNFTVTVTNPVPGGGTSGGKSFTVNNPVPVISGLSPTTVIAGGGAFVLTISGSNFVNTASVNFSGMSLTPQFVSTTQLNVTIPASSIANAGSFPVTVSNPGPGGGTSGSLSFTVNNPVPLASTLSPVSIIAGSGTFALTVNGSNFVSTSTLNFSGQAISPSFVTSSQITATIPASLIAQAGTRPVTVNNPAPGGGTTAVLTFTVNNPVPSLTNLNPASAPTGSGPFLITLTGTNFVTTSTVNFSGTTLTPQFVSSSQMNVTIPASLLAQAGYFPLYVSNPAPGGGISGSLTFTVNNLVPVATSLSPGTIIAGSSAFALTVNGSNFISTSTLNFSGQSITPGFVTSSQLTTTIPASLITQAGIRSVSVTNPTPGGGTSGTLTFTVNNPSPSLTSLSPASVIAGSPDILVSLTGSNFVTTSTVTYSGQAFTPQFVSSSSLKVTIPAALLAKAGQGTMTVSNPAPGGGPSGGQFLTVNNPAPVISSIVPNSSTAGGGGFTLTINGSNFVTTSTVSFSGIQLATTYVNGSQLTSVVSAGNITIAGVSPVTVNNPAPGGGVSNSYSFTINNPVPSIASLSQSSVTAGGPNLLLTLTGNNFVTTSTVNYSGQTLLPNFVSTSQLNVTIQASLISSAGIYPVAVVNPAPGGGSSLSLNFTVNNPAPLTISITPSSVLLGSGNTLLTVNGTNFVTTSTISFSGIPLPATYINSNQLTATIPASNLVTAGYDSVTITNPAPGGGVSNAQTFSVTNPLPVVSSISPSTILPGSGPLTLTVNGTNFVPTSTVIFDGQSYIPTANSPIQLIVIIPAFAVATAHSAQVMVVNPAPGGGNSSSNTLLINTPPVANAGLNQNGATGTVVNLDGRNSYDADPGDLITFNWSLISAPSGSAAAISNSSSVSPTIIPVLPGVYQIQLIVNDGKVNSAPSTVIITAYSGNSPPNADAGLNQTVNVGQTVTLDGRKSADPNNDKISYQWNLLSAPSGNGSALTNAGSVISSLTPDSVGIYQVQLVVTDSYGNTGGAAVQITASSSGAPPTANAGKNQNVLTNITSVTLDGTGSSDPTGKPLSYQWSFESVPAGSVTSLGNATSPNPNFTPDVSGDYLAKLVVNNGTSYSPPSSVLIRAGSPAGPNAVAGADQIVYQSDTVTLDGTGSTDPNSYMLSYNWLLVSTPVGSQAALSSTAVSKPTFVADLNGAYVVRLFVSDGFNTSFADVVVVKTRNLVSIAVTPVNPTLSLGQTLGFSATGTFADSTTKNLTNIVSWSSSNTAIATINSSGTATGLAGGSTQISASYGSIVSPSQTLSVNNPLPTLSTLTPSSAIAGSGSFSLKLVGNAFVPGVTLFFGSQSLTTTFTDASHLSAIVPGSAISSPGTVLVSVQNPAPGGGVSNSISFNIIGPVINSIYPTSGPIGTVLTITGQNFDPVPSNNQVRLNSTPAVITSASTTQIQTLIPEGASTGPVFVTTPQGITTSTTLFNVTLSADFTLNGLPSNGQTVQGSPATFMLTSSSIGSIPYTGLISLTTGTLPAGVTALFTPPQITPGGQSILTVNTPSTLTTGVYPISISGSAQIDGQTVTHQSNVTLQALAVGTTTLYGQVLSSDGPPLLGVTVTLGSAVSYTDGAGNFFLQNIPTGPQMLAIDGRTANSPGNFYPQVDVAVTVNPGASNPLGYTLYLPKLDIMHPINLPINSNGTTTQTVNATTPLIPDLTVTIPAGTKIIDPNGNPVSQITITPVPIDKSPMPLPPGVNVAQLFSIQPGGSVPSQPLPICFPNNTNMPPGTTATIYYFDLVSGNWKSWGVGTVSADGRQICSNAGYGLPRFAWHFVSCGSSSGTGASGSGGEPVDIATGQFMVNKTDLVVPGLMPISLRRNYLSGNNADGPFGIGTVNPYAWYLTGDSRSYLSLVTGDGRTANFFNTGAYPVGSPSSTFLNTTEPWLSGAVLTGFFSNGWTLTLKDGTTYGFNGYHSGDGNVTSITDRDGNHTTLTYQSSSGPTPGQITQITDTSGRSINLTYDANNHMIQATDPIGRTVNYSYDSTGHLLTVTDSNGGVTTYGYDSNGRISTVTDARGILYLSNQYDTNGRVIQQTQADGGVWTFAYQTNGSIVTQTTVTDPSASAVVHRMNGAGYKLGQTDPLGQTTTYNRTFGTNQLQSTTDPLGRTTSYTYDANSNITSITDPVGNITRMTYELVFNKVTSITDPLGNVKQFGYDANGNLTSTTDPLGNVTQMSYNGQGQPLTVTDPLGNVTQFAYDSTGNLITTKDPLGNQTSRNYDAVSRLIQVTDPLNNTTSYSYDPLNRVTQITDALSGLTNFGYDLNGNLLSVMDANGHATTNSYDNMDHLATRTDPLLRQESYAYDTNGNLISFTDRKGQKTQYQYDALQRRILTTFGDGSTISNSYDDAGRLAAINDSSSGIIQYGYDTLNRKIKEIIPQGMITYSHDPLGRRTSMTVNGQTPVSYAYDASSRLTTLMALSQSYSMTYDPDGRGTTLNYPNGVTTNYSYDADSRILNILHQAGASTVENIGYNYDQNGNRIGLTRVNGSATDLPQALQTAFDFANEMTNYNSAAPNLTYDSNGNLTSDGTNAYIWNARNQLVAISGNVTASFQYDALGRRISKTINGNQTNYQYDEKDIVAEINGEAVDGIYIRSLKVDEPLARISPNGQEYYHTDALGSVINLTNSSGVTTVSYNYDPFGNTIQTGISMNPFQFTGRENDNDGLYYYRARYYSPALQRFISEDPIGLKGGINFYAYVLNNPLKFMDSTGTINNSGYGTHMKPPFPNGNYTPEYGDQDYKCSVSLIGPVMDSDPCILGCCKVHDKCYEDNKCNASSWRGNYYGWDLPCQRCNSAAVSCISIAVLSLPSGFTCDGPCK